MAVRLYITVLQSIEIAFWTDKKVSQQIEITLGGYYCVSANRDCLRRDITVSQRQ